MIWGNVPLCDGYEGSDQLHIVRWIDSFWHVEHSRTATVIVDLLNTTKSGVQ